MLVMSLDNKVAPHNSSLGIDSGVVDEEMMYNTNFILHESIYKSDD